MAIVFSIDMFMSEVRALTNITGNGGATVFVSWWEDELDHGKLYATSTKRSIRRTWKLLLQPADPAQFRH
jgi:aerobic C4-dicarboxylate transport protein